MDWGMISIPLAVIFFIVSIILTLKVTKRKKPVWACKTTKIIGLGTNAPPELKLTFSDRPVNEVYQTTFIMFNKGAEAIRKDDVIESVIIHFKGAEILRQPIIRAKSKEAIEFSAKQVVKGGDNSVQLDFLYLDHEDGAVVEVIHTECKDISYTANVIGAKKIVNIGEFKPSRRRFLGARVMLATIFFIMFMSFAIFIGLVLKEERLFGLAIASLLGLGSLTFIPEIYGYFGYRKFPGWSRKIRVEGAPAEGPIEVYCVKCRTRKPIEAPAFVTLKDGRLAITGVCPDCGTKVFRIPPSS